MKKLPIIFSVVLFLNVTCAFSQQDTSAKKSFFAVKTDLVFLAYNVTGSLNAAKITFEKGFSYRHSFQITSGYIFANNNNLGQAWRVIPEYKFFFKRNDFKGFYAGVYTKYENYNRLYTVPVKSGTETRNVKEIRRTYGLGVTFGFQTYIRKHLTLDFLLGLGAKQNNIQYVIPPDVNFYIMKSTTPQRFKNLDGRICINLGYRF